MALSRLHIAPQQFYDLSPAEFYEALKDHQDRETIKLEQQVQSIYDAMRLNALVVYNSAMGRKKGIKNPKDLFAFPWDKQEKEQSNEELKAGLLNYFTKHNNSLNKKQKQPRVGG